MPEKSSWRRTAWFARSLGVAVSLLIHGAPRAETVKDSDSAKALLGDVLEYIKTSITSADEDLTLKLEAEPSAKVRGNITKLIFPTPSILDKNGAGFHLGNVTANVALQNKDEFQFSVGLPSPMTVSGTSGLTEAEVSWAANRLHGIWRADLEVATEFHSALKSLLFTDIKQGEKHLVGKIDSIAIDQKFAESTNGWWNGQLAYDVANIELAPANKDERVSLESVSVSSKLQDFDFASWQALFEWGSSFSIAADGTLPSSQGDSRAARQILETMNLGAGNMGLSIANLIYGPPGRPEFKMGELNLNMNYDNDARPGTYSYYLDWRGLEQTDDDIPSAYFTHTGVIKMHLEQFPLRQILTSVLRETQKLSPPVDPANIDFGAPLQLMALPMINANKTRLRLEELMLRSSIAALTASGNLSAEKDSALGAVGNARFELAGLDKLIAVAARQAFSDEDAAKLLASLTFAKGLGRPEVGTEGGLVYIYDVILPAGGVVLINEIPLNLL